MRRPIIIILLLVWPLYLNDLYLIPLQDAQQSIAWWGIDSVFRLLIPGATLWFLFTSKTVSCSEAGLIKPFSLSAILAGALLAFALLITSRVLIEPWLWNFLPYGELFFGYILPDHGPYYFIAIIYFVITAGVFEEIIYRALVTSQLEKMTESKTLVVIFSCIIFAAIHWSEGIAKVIFSFFIALPLTLWYMRTRRVWGMISCHIIYDFLQFTF